MKNAKTKANHSSLILFKTLNAYECKTAQYKRKSLLYLILLTPEHVRTVKLYVLQHRTPVNEAWGQIWPRSRVKNKTNISTDTLYKILWQTWQHFMSAE